jgi:curved DNA-binding protein CbpA
MSRGSSDIYRVLGVAPNASPRLAREMYWVRIAQYLEADRRGDREARRAIEELNAALAIMLDDRLRAEYDELREQETHLGAGEASRPGDVRWLIVAVSGLAASALTFVALDLTPAVLVLATGLAVAALMIRRGRRTRGGRSDPSLLLQLPEAAPPEDIDIAYRTRVEELLSRLRFDASVLAELELLDDAYGRAIARSVRDRSPRGGPLEPGRGRRGGAFRRAWLAGARAVRASAARSRVSRAAVRRRRHAIVSRAARAMPAALRRGHVELPASLRDVDLDRRIAAGFKRAGRSDVQPPGSDEPSPQHVAGAPAYLLLRAAGGTRRIPIGRSPLRIGSDDVCDVVLPSWAGVSPEHATVWRRDDALILHVVDPSATCTVNGRALAWAVLDDGDELQLGEITLAIEVGQ